MASSHVGVLTSSEPVNGKTIRSLIEVLSDYLFGQLDIGWLIGLPLGSVPKGDLISQSGEVALLFHTGFPFHGKLLKKDPKPGDLT